MTVSIRKEDWERFRAMGRVPPSIREIVLQSWRRSESLGGAHLKRAPSVGEEALARIRRENRSLRRAARPALDHSGYLLKDASAMILLCDREGVIMEMVGDQAVLERGKENHLAAGGRWAESAMGTNAIGTALHTRRSVEISGVEHFCEEIQRWNCAATPILHPATGDLLGVVDVSGPAERGQPHGAALSSTLALQMEEALRHELESERRRLLERLLKRRALWREDDLILFDRFGAEIYATERFARTASEIGDFEGWRAASIWSEGALDEAFRERLVAALPGAQVEVIQEKEEPLGLVIALRRARRRTRGGEARAEEAAEAPDLAWISGGGEPMAGLCQDARRLAKSARAILIEGETGVGKETLARALHREAGQGRAGRRFEILSCGLLSIERLREEIGPRGLVEQLARDGGTLCLDEPAETPPEAQAALMELLRAVWAAPSESPAAVHTLSTRDLAAEAEEGRLRRDLYYRLAGARLTLPPLRERREEIPRLALRFAEEAAARSGDKPLRFTPAALARLKAHDWFGNVRELRNLVESLSSLSLNRLADLRDLPPEIAPPRREAAEETLRDREKAEILAMVAAVDGNLTEAAKRLGVARSTLYLKLDSYGFRRAPARR